MFKLGVWTIDPASREVSDGTSVTRLSPKAVGVLKALDEADGQVVSRTDLLDTVWAGVTVGEEVLTHAIAELRRAFGDSARNPKIVETVHRTGYRLRVRSEPVGDTDQASSPTADTDEPSSEEKRPAHGEIKQVTIMMVDLGPAVADLARQGPEAAERTFDALAGQTETIAQRFGGTLTDRLNDLIVVAFGAPVSIGDHAHRAAAAALALLAKADIGHTIRLALSSGEVAQRAGSRQDGLQLSGLPISVGAEILATAPPGRIWLDEETQRRGAKSLRVVPLAPDVAPVSGGRYRIYELKDVVADGPRTEHLSGTGRTRYVCRQLEMALLRESAGEVLTGRGRIIAISGEAGIGKTRLFREFLAELPSDEWLILKASSPRGETAPFRGASRMIRHYMGILPSDDTDIAKSKLLARLAELGDTKDLEVPLATLLYLPTDDEYFSTLTPARRLERIEDAFRRLLVLEAARRPVALVLEDLHWIDSRSESSLNTVLSTVPSNRIMAMLNFRPDYTPTFLGMPAVTHRRLDALTDDAEAEMLDVLIGNAPELDPVRQAVADRARGNPLFIEEIVSSLIEKGVLERSAGICKRGTEPLDAIKTVPSTVQEILAARIDGMQPQDKELLRICAAIGRESRRGLVGAVTGIPDDALRTSLHRLQNADLLRQDALEPDGRIIFKHDMTHEVAYAGLHSDGRRALHQRIAEAMEASERYNDPGEAPRLAEHWTLAGAPARAIPYWQQTGRDALYRAANRSAVRYFETALSLIPDVPDSIDRQWRELELSLALGVALVAAEGIGSDRARTVYARAEALAIWLGARRHKFIAQWGLHHNSETREAFPQAVELTYRMSETAREANDPTLILQADHASWATRLAQGRLDDVLRLTGTSEALYHQCPDHGDASQFAGHDPHACALSHAAVAHWIKGDAEVARTHAQQALDHADSVNHPTSIAHALMFLAKIRFLDEEPEALVEICDRLSVLAEEHGFVDYADIAVFLKSWAEWTMAGRKGPPANFDKGLAAAQRLCKTTAEVLFVPEAAQMRAACGDREAGLAMIDEALAVSAKKGVALMDAELHRVAAAISETGGGNLKQPARDRLTRAMEIAEAQGASAFAQRVRRDMERVQT